MPTTDADLKRLAAAATPGTWTLCIRDGKVCDCGRVYQSGNCGGLGKAVAFTYNQDGDTGQLGNRANTHYIAAASPDRILSLLASREDLRNALVQAVGALERLSTWQLEEFSCTYRGGYHTPEELEIFDHGMATIINCIRASVAVVLGEGRTALAKEEP